MSDHLDVLGLDSIEGLRLTPELLKFRDEVMGCVQINRDQERSREERDAAFKKAVELLGRINDPIERDVPYDTVRKGSFGEFKFHVENGAAKLMRAQVEECFVTVPSFIVDDQGREIPVKEIGSSAFSNAQKLKYLVVSEGIEKIDSTAFAYSGSLVDLVLPSSLKKLGSIFWNTPQYESDEGGVVYYAGTPDDFEALLQESAEEMIMDCTPYQKLTRYIGSVDEYSIPEIDFRVVRGANEGEGGEGGSYAVVRTCRLSGEVTIPETAVIDGVELPVKVIGRSSISENPDLTKLIVPASVDVIGQDACYGCRSLREVEVLAGDTDVIIGKGAFFLCENLGDFHLRRKAFIRDFAFGKVANLNLIEYC